MKKKTIADDAPLIIPSNASFYSMVQFLYELYGLIVIMYIFLHQSAFEWFILSTHFLLHFAHLRIYSMWSIFVDLYGLN